MAVGECTRSALSSFPAPSGLGSSRPYMLAMTSSRLWVPHVASAARSIRSNSSSFSTACLPCLRSQMANLASESSTASAISLRRHTCLWNGQCARWQPAEQKNALRHLLQRSIPEERPQLPASALSVMFLYSCKIQLVLLCACRRSVQVDFNGSQSRLTAFPDFRRFPVEHDAELGNDWCSGPHAPANGLLRRCVGVERPKKGLRAASTASEVVKGENCSEVVPAIGGTLYIN
jgi:hypothetical protein